MNVVSWEQFYCIINVILFVVFTGKTGILGFSPALDIGIIFYDAIACKNWKWGRSNPSTYIVAQGLTPPCDRIVTLFFEAQYRKKREPPASKLMLLLWL